MDVLEVTYDSALTFRHHIERLARDALGKLVSLRRMSWLLDDKGQEILYKAQVRSSLMPCLGRSGEQASFPPGQGTGLGSEGHKGQWGQK
ncbi:hypothetical protein E2C01_060412 [Portunus trituberculatus]|uniref:Uncharacterized protein n=1 Tax=Portunus trituberculatus TaxID=210409 RepID=A0A5B7H9D9_PORTR|nr:hypothetical protein [Portunus trituberculatus]